MYTFFSLLTGIILSFMVVVNGYLSQRYGVFLAAVIIHIVGFFVAFIAYIFKNEKIKLKYKKPFWIYLGGVIGVLTTLFQNMAFGKISVTNILALALLGQSISSLLIDHFGLLGMEICPLKKYNIPGLIISFLGIFFLFDKFISVSAILAILLSFSSGVIIVLSRTANARLSEQTNAIFSSMFAHLSGLPFTVIIAIMFSNIYPPKTQMPFRPWIYLGGLMGVVIILLCNITVPKIPAFHLTILIFLGQIFSAIAIDIVLKNEYSTSSFLGGIVICIGIIINNILDYKYKEKNCSYTKQ